MNFVFNLIKNALGQTLLSLSHNWPFLLASILIAAILKALVDARKVSSLLDRFKGAGVLAATAAAVATPLCSCGTTAVVLGMMATTMPWAPIVAFMVASPLSSPEGMVYSAGLFGWPFAIYYFAASILLGLAGGAIAAVLQKAGLLEGQVRYKDKAASSAPAACDCSEAAPARQASRSARRYFPAAASPRRAAVLLASVSAPACGCAAEASSAQACCGASPAFDLRPSAIGKAEELARAALDVAKTILPMFVGFAFLGFLLNGLIPASAIGALFGAGRAYGVPLAATIGLPLYVNSEASMPLVRALQDSGMSPGAIMAFLIAGSGTSIGAIGGALTIARWRIVGLVVAVLWVGAIAVGYGYNALVALGVL